MHAEEAVTAEGGCGTMNAEDEEKMTSGGKTLLLVVGVLGVTALAGTVQGQERAERPVMREFMGLCVHTVQFRPELYRGVCGKVRDYHSMSWDVGEETDFTPPWPFARNRVNWEEMYGGWGRAGYGIDVSIMFNGTPPGKWKDMERDARNYGERFARFFGPSGERKLVESAEIGNEPGEYDDASYRKLFEGLARGMRKGDRKLKVATCGATDGASTKYARSLGVFEGLGELYDVITVHDYAQVEGWPTWRRSYPEDPKIGFLKEAERVCAWRDEHAAGKEVWVTEFGWDASTKKAPTEGDFKGWVGSTETEQAQYLVRGFLAFAEMNVGRAYIFWFNDKDEPQVHGSSGLTRNYEPKPSFHAVGHLYQTLGEYRFSRVVKKEEGDCYVYEFRHGTEAKKRIWVAWSPTGSGRKATKEIDHSGLELVKMERMPMKAGGGEAVPIVIDDVGTAIVEVTESPVYMWMEER